MSVYYRNSNNYRSTILYRPPSFTTSDQSISSSSRIQQSEVDYTVDTGVNIKATSSVSVDAKARITREMNNDVSASANVLAVVEHTITVSARTTREYGSTISSLARIQHEHVSQTVGATANIFVPPADWEVATSSDQFIFDTSERGISLQIVPLDSTHFMINWDGRTSGLGFSQVLGINSSTWEVTAAGAKLTLDGSPSTQASAKIDGNHSIVLLDDRKARILNVDTSTWAITTSAPTSVLDTFLSQQALVVIDDNHVFATWRGYSGAATGRAQVLEVNTSTWAVTTAGAVATIDTQESQHTRVTLIDSTHVLVFKQGTDMDGFMQVLAIDTSTWAITTSSTLEFDTQNMWGNTSVMIDTNHFVCLWRGGALNHGLAQVFEINTSTWVITTAGAQLDFIPTNASYLSMVTVRENFVVITWANGFYRSDAQVLEINTSTWGITAIETPLQYSESESTQQVVSQVDTGHYLAAWSRYDTGTPALTGVTAQILSVTVPPRSVSVTAKSSISALPTDLNNWGGAGAATNSVYTMTLDNSSKKAAMRFSPPRDITATEITINIEQTTGPGVPVYRVGIQGESAGFPSGTFLTSTTHESTVGTRFDLAVDPYLLEAGTNYFIVIQYESGTIGASNNAVIRVSAGLDDTRYPNTLEEGNLAGYISDDGGSTWTHTGGASIFAVNREIGQPYGTFLSAGSIYGTRLRGEAFKLSEGRTIDRISFILKKYVGSPIEDVDFEIRDATSVLRSGQLADNANITSSYTEFVATLSPITLSANTLYYAVVKVRGGGDDSGNFIACAILDIGESRYAAIAYGGIHGGFAALSSDGGSSWSDAATLGRYDTYVNAWLFNPSVTVSAKASIAGSPATQQSIDALARVRHESSSTIDALARVQKVSTESLDAGANILKSQENEVIASSNILATSEQSLNTGADIRNTGDAELTSGANILVTNERTLDALARIRQEEIAYTVNARANIRGEISSNSGAKARITRGEGDETNAKANIKTTYGRDVEAGANIRHGYSDSLSAVGNVMTGMVASIHATSSIQRVVDAQMDAAGNILAVAGPGIDALARVERTEDVTIEVGSNVRNMNETSIVALGRVQRDEVEQTVDGTSNIKNTEEATLSAIARIEIEPTTSLDARANVRGIAEQNEESAANIRHEYESTLDSTSRIQRTENAMVGAKASVLNYGEQFISAVASTQRMQSQIVGVKSRIEQVRSETLTAQSRVQRTEAGLIGSLARVQMESSGNVGALGRVLVSEVEATISAISNIRATSSSEIEATARIGVEFMTNIDARSNIKGMVGREEESVANIRHEYESAASSVSRVQRTEQGTVDVNASVLNHMEQNISAVANIRKTQSQTVDAKSRVEKTNSETVVAQSRTQVDEVEYTSESITNIRATNSAEVSSRSRITREEGREFIASANIKAMYSPDLVARANVRVMHGSIIESRSRITRTESQDAQAGGRVSREESGTVNAGARTQRTEDGSLDSLSRIQREESSDISALSRVLVSEIEVLISTIVNIRATNSGAVEATSRIEKESVSQLDASANVRNMVEQSLNAKTRIIKEVEETLEGKARVSRGESATITGSADILVEHEGTVTASARVYLFKIEEVDARARITRTEQSLLSSKARIQRNEVATVQSKSDIIRLYSRTIYASANIQRMLVVEIVNDGGSTRGAEVIRPKVKILEVIGRRITVR